MPSLSRPWFLNRFYISINGSYSVMTEEWFEEALGTPIRVGVTTFMILAVDSDLLLLSPSPVFSDFCAGKHKSLPIWLLVQSTYSDKVSFGEQV